MVRFGYGVAIKVINSEDDVMVMHYLIVSCVGGKSLKGPKLKNMQGDLTTRFQKWIQKVKQAYPERKAKEVYAGSMWDASMSAFSALPEESKLWIVSAGLGLISGEDKIPGYQATFKVGDENSVSRRSKKEAVKENRKWWRELTNENLTGGIAKVSELIDNTSKDDLIVLAMGKDYYQAIYEDLAKCERPESEIAIVGVKKINGNLDPKIPQHLRDFVVPYKDYGKLRTSLDCNMVQVHPRTAEELIKHYRENGDFNLQLDGLAEMD